MTRPELMLTLRQELSGYPGLDFALLFGSQAREPARPGSDVDVAVMPLGDWPLSAELDLQGQLARAIGASVDLVRLDRAEPTHGAWPSWDPQQNDQRTFGWAQRRRL